MTRQMEEWLRKKQPPPRGDVEEEEVLCEERKIAQAFQSLRRRGTLTNGQAIALKEMWPGTDWPVWEAAAQEISEEIARVAKIKSPDEADYEVGEGALHLLTTGVRLREGGRKAQDVHRAVAAWAGFGTCREAIQVWKETGEKGLRGRLDGKKLSDWLAAVGRATKEETENSEEETGEEGSKKASATPTPGVAGSPQKGMGEGRGGPAGRSTKGKQAAKRDRKTG